MRRVNRAGPKPAGWEGDEAALEALSRQPMNARALWSAVLARAIEDAVLLVRVDHPGGSLPPRGGRGWKNVRGWRRWLRSGDCRIVCEGAGVRQASVVAYVEATWKRMKASPPSWLRGAA